MLQKAKIVQNVTVNINDIQELLSLISKLNDEQKKLILATLRGAVLIADAENAEKKGA